jgi:hypothetical protein
VTATIDGFAYPITCSIDWKDGTVTDGCLAEHKYLSTGVYEPTASVTSPVVSGNGYGSYQYVVIYDASGGFVTGGGWINSPAGAYAADPNLTGKASFGFNSKYQKGATVPSGDTQFQFQAGYLNFKSTKYEWLVISGARAQYKGSGTINGAGNYGFMLTAIDSGINGGGNADRFRIKIWDNADPNNPVTVYDNQMGTSDTDSLSTDGTLLGGGSIVIHK